MGVIFAVDDIIVTKVLCWVNYQVGINVRHWKVSDNPGNVTLEELLELWETDLVPFYAGYLSTATIVDALKAQIIDPAPSMEVTRLLGTAGLATATTMPRQACGVVTLLTGLGGRKNRGRFYVPFPTEEMNEANGSPNAAAGTVMADLGTFYTSHYGINIDGTRTAGLDPVLVHRGPAPDAPTPLTSFIVRDKWGTQKRRGDYGKLNARLS